MSIGPSSSTPSQGVYEYDCEGSVDSVRDLENALKKTFFCPQHQSRVALTTPYGKITVQTKLEKTEETISREIKVVMQREVPVPHDFLEQFFGVGVDVGLESGFPAEFIHELIDTMKRSARMIEQRSEKVHQEGPRTTNLMTCDLTDFDGRTDSVAEAMAAKVATFVQAFNADWYEKPFPFTKEHALHEVLAQGNVSASSESETSLSEDGVS